MKPMVIVTSATAVIGLVVAMTAAPLWMQLATKEYVQDEDQQIAAAVVVIATDMRRIEEVQTEERLQRYYVALYEFREKHGPNPSDPVLQKALVSLQAEIERNEVRLKKLRN